MSKQKPKYLTNTLIIIAITILGIGAYKFDSLRSQIRNISSGAIIAYSGENGKTVLELLKQKTKVVIAGSGVSSYVASINGISANFDTQYWEFIVNGKSSTISADNYITKTTDSIAWKLVSF